MQHFHQIMSLPMYVHTLCSRPSTLAADKMFDSDQIWLLHVQNWDLLRTFKFPVTKWIRKCEPGRSPRRWHAYVEETVSYVWTKWLRMERPGIVVLCVWLHLTDIESSTRKAQAMLVLLHIVDYWVHLMKRQLSGSIYVGGWHNIVTTSLSLCNIVFSRIVNYHKMGGELTLMVKKFFQKFSASNL